MAHQSTKIAPSMNETGKPCKQTSESASFSLPDASLSEKAYTLHLTSLL